MKILETYSGKKLYMSYAKALVAIGSISLAFSCGTKKNVSRPNILLILSDDHSPAAISAYGQSLIKTPNIDRIAANGVRFSNCFTVVSLSAPSRAAILTGKYSAINRVFKIGNVLDSTQTTFPKILHDAGYQTALFGKWHLRSRPVGFDYFNIIHDQGSYFNCPVKNNGEEWTMGAGNNVVPEYITDALTDQSIQWLENRDKRKPFCLLLHHKAPHHPWVYPENYDTLFANKDLPEPETFNDDYTGKNQYILKEPCRFSKLQYVHSWHFEEPVPEGIMTGSEEYKKWAYQKVFKGYYRLVASLDDNIGRLLDYLQKKGLDKNTIIIYMSDNGFFLGDHGLFNKQWMYDESIRIPLIISLPGKDKKEEVNDKIVSELDLASTILDYTHLEIPADFQGQSLKPLIEGKESESWRKYHFYHYFKQYEVPENCGIRTEKFKLNNQINNPDFKQTIDSLKRELVYAKNKFETKAAFPE